MNSKIHNFFESFANATKQKIFTKECIVDVLIHVLLMTLFISSLFYFYTSYEISWGLKSSLKNFSNGAIPIPLLTPSQLNLCESTYSKERYNNAIKEAKKESDKMPFQYSPNFINMCIMYSIWFFVLIAVSFFVFHFHIPVKNLIISNIILFIFLGGIEYFFIYNILRYVPEKFSLITDTLFDNIIKFLYVPPY